MLLIGYLCWYFASGQLSRMLFCGSFFISNHQGSLTIFMLYAHYSQTNPENYFRHVLFHLLYSTQLYFIIFICSALLTLSIHVLCKFHNSLCFHFCIANTIRLIDSCVCLWNCGRRSNAIIFLHFRSKLTVMNQGVLYREKAGEPGSCYESESV